MNIFMVKFLRFFYFIFMLSKPKAPCFYARKPGIVDCRFAANIAAKDKYK